ncbi:MAG: T9SS type A sorting domain-containing protein [Candidatus Cloacimonetes bacterium]|nr:T9SS type A sorting domain-containing protein [Candidatus Cloacimonadota bacterium]MCF7813598.1 T9SS type A sorting domain-containing protein [Candidatus Cloacimonadota bacterium]MCF7867914.1 T9SS type A sorting domain-containing protein [Candidatus Cloacimonadota bacterium]MCF7882893.1 T9SS type A sorting domain-containing protein [Candidatus Cloacimonadota bacterium]
MKKGILLTILLTLISLTSAEWVQISNSSDLFSASSDGMSTIISFNLDGFEMQNITERGEEFQKISYQNEGHFLAVGMPSLPRFSRLVAIPDYGNVRLQVNILGEQRYQNVKVLPAQELQSESQQNRNEFIINDDFYRSSEVFPTQIAEVGQPAILRDLRVVNVTINPFQYNAATNELVVYSQVEVELIPQNGAGENIKTTNRKLSRFFEPLYQSTILNYDDFSLREDDYQDPCYLFIYAAGNDVLDNLEYISDWKRQKGFEVHAVSTTETGSDLQDVKDYIQNAYDTWPNPPEFVCLVGDAGPGVNYNVPTAHLDGGYYTGEGDQYYSLLEGDDILADVHLGRLSFNSISELQTIASKILHYEKEPFITNVDWYNKTLVVGDPTFSGTSCIDTKMNVRDMVALNAPDMNITEVYNNSQGSWQMQMSSNINSGVSYFNYRGFANMSGFNVNHIYGLNNGWMLPAAVFITCITGDFEGTIDCRSEAFLKAGTPSQPQGAIGAIATATGNTHTCFNNCVDAGIYYGIFQDKIYNLGGALNRGKLALYMNYPGNPGNHVNQFSYWNNLMGDPGCELWTDVPQDLNVIYNTNIPQGSNFIPVQVTDSSGNPVENAWISILQGDDTIREIAFTDASGSAVLPLPDNASGEVDLTVTKHNFIPHLGSFDIQQATSFVAVESVQIDDDNSGNSSGNGDGVINPGETIELIVTLKNNGTQTANNVTAVISTENDFITISDDSETFGNIAVGATANSLDDFDFSLDADVLNSAEIELEIIIMQSGDPFWIDTIFLPISAAEITFQDFTIDDGSNGILDPGETSQMEITLENIGSIDAADIWAELVSTDNMIVVNDNSGSFGNIIAGSSSTNNVDNFDLTALPPTVPGSVYTLQLNVYNADGYQDCLEFEIEIGEPNIADPTGPDAGGYYCYDDGDTDYMECPTYDWIEIDPNYGGSGTIINFLDLGNSGQVEEVDLPFDLSFYNQVYNSISICTNGWAAPGSCDLTSFMNWTIPGPLGPSPIIAPFWDDLLVINGDVIYQYFDSMHIFVIEWSRVLNEYNSDEETFQMIIYDQNYYPTSNSNNMIKFQYMTVNNVDQGSYGTPLVGHGQYATVGIEDHTSTIGLEYTFNNTYPSTAKELEDEMAILFAGEPMDYVEPFLVLGEISFNDANGNGILEYGETADIQINLNNLGQNVADNVSAVLTSNDQFVTIYNDNSNYGNISGYGTAVNQTDFSIEISELCPNAHYIPFELNVSSSNDNWTLFFSLTAYAPDIQIADNIILDGNNHILDPGETGQLQLTLENQGLSPVENVTLLCSTNDPYFNIISGSITIGNMNAGEILDVFVDISLSNGAPIQHEGTIDLDFSSSSSYSVQHDLLLYVSQALVSVTEEFAIFPPIGWEIQTDQTNSGGWSYSNSNVAGGDFPEIAAICMPNEFYDDYLITPVINTLGSTELELSFRHTLLVNLRNYTVSIVTTSDGENWNEFWSQPGSTIPPQMENLIVDSPDVGSATFQLAFRVLGTTNYTVDGWIIDDFSLSSIDLEPHGFIMGNVTLNGGTGNILTVEVWAGDITKHPDANGDYLLPVPEGTYDVTAFLPGYVSSTASGINVQNWQTTNIDFVLDEINPNNAPQNLTAETVSNDVYLSWEMPGTENIRSTKRSKNQATENREFDNYRIYRNGVMIEETGPITNTEFIDVGLNHGNYTYYVTAYYVEGESAPSNEVEVDVVLSPPSNVTYQITAPMMVLFQWDPPEDTSRSFSHYRVYKDSELVADNLLQTFYFDNYVTPGLHVYGISAVYDNYESACVILQVNMTEAGNQLIPAKTELVGNSPNPFNPATDIEFTLNKETLTSIDIYNLKGEKVKTLLHEILPAANHSITWNGKDDNSKTVSSGIYFYNMKAGEYSATKKMIMLR